MPLAWSRAPAGRRSFALAAESLALATEAKVGQVEQTAATGALEQRAELIGSYAR